MAHAFLSIMLDTLALYYQISFLWLLIWTSLSLFLLLSEVFMHVLVYMYLCITWSFSRVTLLYCTHTWTSLTIFRIQINFLFHPPLFLQIFFLEISTWCGSNDFFVIHDFDLMYFRPLWYFRIHVPTPTNYYMGWKYNYAYITRVCVCV